jgi:hypothetical protein
MSEPLGWMALLSGYGEPGSRPFPLPAYSEFMPPPRLGRKPYGEPDLDLFTQDDPWGWRVSEMEQAWELEPGLAHIAREVYASLLALGRGHEEHLLRGHHGRNLEGNPYWPPELAMAAGRLAHERFVTLLPLALSRTQDDKGRVRWTLFGSSELGPERAFWRGFDREPGREDGAAAVSFLCRLLRQVYGEESADADGLRACGLRVLPSDGRHPHPEWSEDGLPKWALGLTLPETGPFEEVRYLLTFRPFAVLPEAVRRSYLGGALHILPFPGSLTFWGMPTFLHLAETLPSAMQLPLLRLTRRHRGPGIRIPQSGWLHEGGARGIERDLHEAYLAEAFTRTHRWDRVQRHEDELAVLAREDKVARVLFSTDLGAMGLYDKPMARNAQLWTNDFRAVLDGPRATPDAIERAREEVLAGGTFGYRFVYPAMRVGGWQVTWHRPLAAFVAPGEDAPTLIPGGPLGVLVARPAEDPFSGKTVELFPRLLARPLQSAAVSLRHDGHGGLRAAANVLAVAWAWRGLGERPLPHSFVRRLLKARRDETARAWINDLAARAGDSIVAERLARELGAMIAPAPVSPPDGGEPLTFHRTATRAFEEAWWRDLAALAHGEFLTKDNADTVLDPVTQASAPHLRRDLDPLADYLVARHRAAIEAAGMTGKALCGELPFVWRTDFPFSLFGGWRANQNGTVHERDVVVVIPGKTHRQAVVLADHYDTAYMEDVYDTSRSGSGARLAARGADDNCSATATLLQAAPVFLDLAARGRLARDVWLVHLTGEEFPADCMGARALCSALMERATTICVADGRTVDVSETRVVGVVVMDMIAHNRESSPYVFQISPGDGPGSLRVALEAHLANEAWNRGAQRWNAALERRGRRPSRSADPAVIPPAAQHPHLRGEVRLHFESRSSLYNTDGQIFSDVGVPVALFMEDYDINRQGYHDTHDTVANIDLDYGAGVAAIAIETVARLAGARSRV